jgi:transcriptional regulator NrdR family protein
MNCSCGSDTNVVDTRTINEKTNVWRRRKCKACGCLFTTIEQLCETMPGKRGKLHVSERTAKQQIKPVPVKAVVAPRSNTPPRVQTTRNRIEDMRMQKELNNI